MVVLELKRHGCKDIKVNDPTWRDIEITLQLAADAAKRHELEYVRCENRFEENIIKEYNEIW